MAQEANTFTKWLMSVNKCAAGSRERQASMLFTQKSQKGQSFYNGACFNSHIYIHVHFINVYLINVIIYVFHSM